ncbi:MAG: hypothetical protein ACRC7S_18295 [Cetobacterium sp.]
MTIKELIEILERVKDKEKEVVVSSNCCTIESVNIVDKIEYSTCLEIVIDEIN